MFKVMFHLKEANFITMDSNVFLGEPERKYCMTEVFSSFKSQLKIEKGYVIGQPAY